MSIKLQRIITHIAVKFMDLSLSQNFFDLDTHFSKRRILRASKRDLEREISTTVDRDWIFFLAEVSKYKASCCSIFSRLSLNKIRLRVIHFFNHTVIHFSRAMKLYKHFYKLFRGIMNSASFDLSITPLVLILDISRLTGLLRESSCHANRCTDNTRSFRALQSRN